jgi:hypothetical protein
MPQSRPLLIRPEKRKLIDRSMGRQRECRRLEFVHFVGYASACHWTGPALSNAGPIALSRYCIPIVTVFDAIPSTVSTTLTVPAPRKLAGRSMFI